jgi:hypothetical protein
MWEMLGTAAWVIAAAIFAWLAFDFIRVNKQTSEELLLSSREGVDELFAEGKPKGGTKS